MHIPYPVVDLAGLALGHALWNVCDFEEEDDLLCPLAFTFDGQREKLLRFEGESQEEAIERGFSTLSSNNSFVRWAFAREGIIRTADGPTDILLIDAWGQGMEQSVVFAQPFLPAISGQFCLLGEPAVFVSGQPNSDRSLISRLKSGVMSHQKAAELWTLWQGW